VRGHAVTISPLPGEAEWGQIGFIWAAGESAACIGAVKNISAGCLRPDGCLRRLRPVRSSSFRLCYATTYSCCRRFFVSSYWAKLVFNIFFAEGGSARWPAQSVGPWKA
jgi:hypothetical protein